MALTVAISGDLNINQGDTTVLTAVVTDSGGNTPSGTITYHWTAPRGSFQGATDQASATYHADFTDADDVDVIVTCSVAIAANPNPTVSTGSLTAMTALGITGQILNMYITETENTANGSNTILYAEGSSDSALEAGSDDDLSSDLNIYRVSWRGNTDGFVLEDNTAGNLGDFFRNNTTQSVFVVFSDGTVFEITQAMFASGGTSWSRWNLTDAGIATKFDNLGADDTLLVGVGDAGSIGLDADTGSSTATVTAAASMATLMPPVIASVADQIFIVDVEVMLNVSITGIDITDDDHSVEVEGLLLGLYYSWNDSEDRVEIRGTPESLVSEVVFVITATNDDGTATRNVNWEVVPATPIIDEIGATTIFKGVFNRIFVPVQNRATQISVDGLFSALLFEPTTRNINDEDVSGVEIRGVIPDGVEFTVDATEFAVGAENDGGRDTYNIPISIEDTRGLYLFDETGDDLLRISPAGALLWTYEAPTGVYGDVVLGRARDIFLFSGADDLIKINPDGVVAWTYDAPMKDYSPLVPTTDDGGAFLFNRTDNDLYKIDSDGELEWTYDANNPPKQIEIRGASSDSGCYLFSITDADLYKIDSDGELEWTYDGPSGSYVFFTLTAEDDFYLGLNTGEVIKVNPDGTEGWRYSGGRLDAAPIINSDDTVYLKRTSEVQKVSASGSREWAYTFTTSVGFVTAVDPNDNSIYLKGEFSGEDLRKLNVDGTLAWAYTPTGEYFAQVYVDSSGNPIIFDDLSVYRIRKLNSSGTVLWTYTLPTPPNTGELGRYDNLMIDAEDNIYVFNEFEDKLYKVSPSGSLLWTYNASTGLYDDVILA